MEASLYNALMTQMRTMRKKRECTHVHVGYTADTSEYGIHLLKDLG